jgi:hypothetical protein
MAVHATPVSPPIAAGFDSAERSGVQGYVLAFTWHDASPERASGYWDVSKEFSEPHVEYIAATAMKSLDIRL